MQHVTLKAATAVQTDQGTFTAVISTVSVDRDRDIIEPLAMVDALAKWTSVGKLVPLAWDHTKDVIGHIDPQSVAIEGGREVVAKGWIDQDTERGREAWRLVKSGTLSFSFGFLFDREKGGTPRKGGGYHIHELDVFEISAIPIAPANNDTRVIDWKSADPLVEEHRDAKVGFLDATIKAETPKPPPEPEPEPVPPPSEQEVRKQADGVTREQARAAKQAVPPPPPDPMAEAFKGFDPAGKTPLQIAKELDGLKLGNMTLYVRAFTEGEKQAQQERMIKRAEADKEPQVRSVDPLIREAQAISLEFASKGAPPSPKAPPQPEPGPSPEDYRREWAEMVQVHMRGTHAD